MRSYNETSRFGRASLRIRFLKNFPKSVQDQSRARKARVFRGANFGFGEKVRRLRNSPLAYFIGTNSPSGRRTKVAKCTSVQSPAGCV